MFAPWCVTSVLNWWRPVVSFLTLDSTSGFLLTQAGANVKGPGGPVPLRPGGGVSRRARVRRRRPPAEASRANPRRGPPPPNSSSLRPMRLYSAAAGPTPFCGENASFSTGKMYIRQERRIFSLNIYEKKHKEDVYLQVATERVCEKLAVRRCRTTTSPASSPGSLPRPSS